MDFNPFSRKCLGNFKVPAWAPWRVPSDANTDVIDVAGCDDASVGSCEGLVTVDFDREAESLGDASAVKDAAKAGLRRGKGRSGQAGAS